MGGRRRTALSRRDARTMGLRAVSARNGGKGATVGSHGVERA